MHTILDANEGALQILRDQPLTFFAGAGISMAPPTQLPGAIRLKTALIAALTGGDYGDEPNQVRQHLFQFLHTQVESTHVAEDTEDRVCALWQAMVEDLPLEALLQFMHNEIGDIVLSAFDLLRLPEGRAQWNYEHKCIAALAQRDMQAGHAAVIVTTNFDNCLEEAVESLGLTRNSGYRVCEAEEQFPSPQTLASSAGKLIWILKLHGSLGDSQRLDATLDRMRSQLPQHKRAALAWVLENRRVCFVGWKGIDWDIMPALQASAPTSIPPIFLAHVGSSVMDTDTYTMAMDYIKSAYGTTISCDAGTVFAHLHTILGIPEQSNEAELPVPFESKLKNWWRQNGADTPSQLAFRQYIILAALYEYVGQGILCLRSAQTALDHAHNSRERSLAYHWMAAGRERLGDSKSLRDWQFSLSHARRAGDRLLIAQALYGLGNTPRVLGTKRLPLLLGPFRLALALRSYQRQLGDEDTRDKAARGAAWTLMSLSLYIRAVGEQLYRVKVTSLGAWNMRLSRHLLLQAQALVEGSRTGDIHAEANIMRYLGAISSRLARADIDFRCADESFSEAARLFSAISNDVGAANVARARAEMYLIWAELPDLTTVQRENRVRAAERLIQDALQRSLRAGDDAYGIAKAKTLLATLAATHCSASVARVYIQEAHNAWSQVEQGLLRRTAERALSALSAKFYGLPDSRH